jgi:hypothetical protein
MPATLTATGTWTPLGVDLTRMSKLHPNVPHSDRMQLEQLKSADLPELVAFIQLMADGYGIGFQPAKALFFACVQALMNRETPTVSRSYAA